MREDGKVYSAGSWRDMTKRRESQRRANRRYRTTVKGVTANMLADVTARAKRRH